MGRIISNPAIMGTVGGIAGFMVGGPAGATMGAGLGTQVAGQIGEGRTAEAIGKYNENVANMQAKEIEHKAQFDQMRQAEEGARVMSSMEAGQAAAGGGMNLLALAKQRSELELQNLMIGREGAIGAAQARAGGAMAAWQGRQAKRQSYLSAGGTLLQGFGSMAMKMPKSSPTGLGGMSREQTAIKARSWLDEPF